MIPTTLSVSAFRRHRDLIGFEFYVQVGPDDMVAEFSLKKVEPNEVSPAPVEIIREEAQALVEQLWDLGIRPRAATSHDGEILALKAHIADLQKLVFKQEN